MHALRRTPLLQRWLVQRRELGTTVEDPYKVLGLDFTATPAEIKAAYRSAALRTHPDHAGGNEQEAAASFRRVLKAYQSLRNLMPNSASSSSSGARNEWVRSIAGPRTSVAEWLFPAAFGGRSVEETIRFEMLRHGLDDDGSLGPHEQRIQSTLFDKLLQRARDELHAQQQTAQHRRMELAASPLTSGAMAPGKRWRRMQEETPLYVEREEYRWFDDATSQWYLRRSVVRTYANDRVVETVEEDVPIRDDYGF